MREWRGESGNCDYSRASDSFTEGSGYAIYRTERGQEEEGALIWEITKSNQQFFLAHVKFEMSLSHCGNE